jgi:hypothetical protein
MGTSSQKPVPVAAVYDRRWKKPIPALIEGRYKKPDVQ